MDIVQVINRERFTRFLLDSAVDLPEEDGRPPHVGLRDEFRRATRFRPKKIAHHFIDREIRITLKRAWQSVGLWGKTQAHERTFGVSCFWKMKDDIENLKEKDAPYRY
ncbi:MAG: hypothetical protein U1F27_14915 [Turneriella sp.]